jgi:hypothetical protein
MIKSKFCYLNILQIHLVLILLAFLTIFISKLYFLKKLTNLFENSKFIDFSEKHKYSLYGLQIMPQDNTISALN